MNISDIIPSQLYGWLTGACDIGINCLKSSPKYYKLRCVIIEVYTTPTPP